MAEFAPDVEGDHGGIRAGRHQTLQWLDVAYAQGHCMAPHARLHLTTAAAVQRDVGRVVFDASKLFESRQHADVIDGVAVAVVPVHRTHTRDLQRFVVVIVRDPVHRLELLESSRFFDHKPRELFPLHRLISVHVDFLEQINQVRGELPPIVRHRTL